MNNGQQQGACSDPPATSPDSDLPHWRLKSNKVCRGCQGSSGVPSAVQVARLGHRLGTTADAEELHRLQAHAGQHHSRLPRLRGALALSPAALCRIIVTLPFCSRAGVSRPSALRQQGTSPRAVAALKWKDSGCSARSAPRPGQQGPCPTQLAIWFCRLSFTASPMRPMCGARPEVRGETDHCEWFCEHCRVCTTPLFTGTASAHGFCCRAAASSSR